MKISDIDQSLHSEFHIGDIISEKGDGGYKLKVYQGQSDGKERWKYMS